MTTIARLNIDGNVRNNSRVVDKKKPTKLSAPKTRLRLNEALENQTKARQSNAKYSLDPSKEPLLLANVMKKEPKDRNYLSEEIVNRNKVCQINKILFPDKSETYVDDRAGPRCLGSDSLNYLTRNRNSSVLIGDKPCGNFQDSYFSMRCPSNEAVENLEKGRGSRMINVLQHSTDHREIQPSPRLRDEEAAEIYKKNQAGSMANLMNPSRDVRSAVVREPRCPTSEARETWEHSLGHSMSSVMGQGPSNEPTACQISAKKKVFDEDGNEIDPRNSSGMNYVLHHSKESFSTPVNQPRVKWEGEEIALKNRGTLTSEIYNYNKNISEVPSAPRVRPEAQEIADASRGNATKNLMMKYGKLPGDDKPKAHITRYSRKIALQSQGGMMKDALCPPRQVHSKHRVRSAHK